LGHLPGVLLNDLFTDGVKILGLGYRDAAPQVEQGVCQGLQNDFVASAYECDAIAFLQIQRTAELSGNSHLPSPADSTNNHPVYLHSSDKIPFVRHLSL
jgi:hypothetical protein